MSNSEVFLLIDGHALIYRAFYAFPPLTDKTGQLVNALYGFTRILLTAIRDFEPAYVAVAFDHPLPTFRHQDFAEYKAKREEMPDALKPQVALIKNVVEALNIPQFELGGFEADDLIGTIVHQIQQQRIPLETKIVTGDRDAFQLITDSVHVWMPGRGRGKPDVEYGPEEVQEKMGVSPDQIVDLKALMGDSSDNIPGVKGIGPKSARDLITQFGSFAKLYEYVDSAAAVPGTTPTIKPSVLAKLIEHRPAAEMSYKLATIDCQAPIELNLDACRLAEYDKEKVQELLLQYDFRSLLELLPKDEFENSLQQALF